MAIGSAWVNGSWVDAGWVVGAWSGSAPATSITIPAITGGEDLTSMSYVLFNDADIGTASVIKQANDEATDSNGDWVINLTRLGVLDSTVLTVVISNSTTAPTDTNRGAVCFGTAVA